MAILMRYEGIDGESQMAGYEGCLELVSFSWGVSRAIQIIPGRAREATLPAVAEITVSRRADGRSAALLREALSGALDRAVKIHFVRTGVLSATDLMAYELENCGLSGYQVGHSQDGEYPMENLSIGFSRINVLSYPIDDSLRAPPDNASYDLLRGS